MNFSKKFNIPRCFCWVVELSLEPSRSSQSGMNLFEAIIIVLDAEASLSMD